MSSFPSTDALNNSDYTPKGTQGCGRRKAGPSGRYGLGRRLRILIRAQVPFEERPRPVPGIPLIGRVIALERRHVHAPVERVAHARGPGHRVDVDLRLGQVGLPGSQRVDDLLIFDVVDVGVVGRHVNEQRNPQFVDLIERRALDVEVALLERQSLQTRLRRELPLVARSLVQTAGTRGWSRAPSRRRP